MLPHTCRCCCLHDRSPRKANQPGRVIRVHCVCLCSLRRSSLFIFWNEDGKSNGFTPRRLRPRLHQEQTVGCCLWCLLRCSFLWCFLAIFAVPIFVVRAAKVLHFITDLVVSYVGVVVVFSMCCVCSVFFFGGA